MSWPHIIADAVGGGLGGFIGALAAKKYPSCEKWAMGVSLTICILLSNIFIAPIAERRWNEKQAEDALQSFPVYRTIQAHDPKTYAELKNRFTEGLNEGKSTNFLTDEMSIYMVSKIQPYIRVTSDQAAIRQARATTNILDKLDGEHCYASLFPAKNQGKVNAYELVSRADKDEANSSVNEVIEMALNKPSTPATAESTKQSLLSVMNGLQNKTNLQLINKPSLTKEEKTLACKATSELFHGILQLPVDQSGPLLRYLLSTQ